MPLQCMSSVRPLFVVVKEASPYAPRHILSTASKEPERADGTRGRYSSW